MLETTFGDALRGFYYERARKNLIRLAAEPVPPQELATDDAGALRQPRSSPRDPGHVRSSGSRAGRGIVTLAEIVVIGDVEDGIDEADEAREALEQYIRDHRMVAFPEVIVAPGFDDAMTSLVQSHSIGPLKPNVVMLGWPNLADRADPFGRYLRLIRGLGKSAVIVLDRGLPSRRRPGKRIDIWWRSGPNGSLLIILGYLLTLNWEWSNAEMRVLRYIADESERDEARVEIEALIDAARVHAEPLIVSGGQFDHVVHQHSRDSDVVLMGYQAPSPEAAREVWERTNYVTAGLPTTLLVMSSGEADVFA